jgi:Zn/Cd-binding protein ZinT
VGQTHEKKFFWWFFVKIKFFIAPPPPPPPLAKHFSKALNIGFVVVVLLTISCFSGGDPEPELAKWAGTWNPIHDYLDDPGLNASFQAQYDALPDSYKTQIQSVDALRTFAKVIAETDFGSFVIQGNKITFYDQKQTQKNPSGNVIDTVTYTFKGTQQTVYGNEEVDMSTFEGDKEGAYKYLLLEEAERDTPDGPLHFHMRYGSKSFDDLLTSMEGRHSLWAPTIISYDTTIAELVVFMSGDED